MRVRRLLSVDDQLGLDAVTVEGDRNVDGKGFSERLGIVLSIVDAGSMTQCGRDERNANSVWRRLYSLDEGLKERGLLSGIGGTELRSELTSAPQRWFDLARRHFLGQEICDQTIPVRQKGRDAVEDGAVDGL